MWKNLLIGSPALIIFKTMQESPTQKDNTNTEKSNRKESLRDFLVVTVISLAVVFFIRTYIAQPFVVSGASMEPAFQSGEYLIVDQLTYKLEEPKRGDVVIFKYPEFPSKFFIKRIIGLPGETVHIEGETITIKKVDSDEFIEIKEPEIDFKSENFGETVLSDDQYFVMGDNRAASLDSRSWGPLDSEFLIGRAFIRLLPINKIDFLPGDLD